MTADFRPYPATKDSGVQWLGSVPAHWNVFRAGRLLREVDVRSKTGTETHLSMSQRLGLVPSSEIEERRLVSESYIGAKLCELDDLVLNRLKAHLGVFARVSQAGLVSPDYTVLRAVSRDATIAFLEHVLKSLPCRTELRMRAKGLVEGFWRLYTDDFYQIKLPVPPVTEQAAIVRFIDHADRRIRRYIRNKQTLIKLLEEQKRAIIHRAVTRGLDAQSRLRPSGIGWIGDVPEHWETWQVHHFAAVGNGSTPSRGNATYWSGGTFPWLNSSSVNAGLITGSDQFVTERALRECHLPRVPPGSVLVAITGQGKTRGTAAVLAIEATINQHIAFITPRKCGRTATSEYLRQFLVAAYPELRRISEDSGSTKGALTCEDLKHFRVLLPPIDEQNTIVRLAGEATANVESGLRVAEREISLLREYRTRLIADVVTGKVDVREAASQLPEEIKNVKRVDEPDVETDLEESDEGVLAVAEEVEG